MDEVSWPVGIFFANGDVEVQAAREFLGAQVLGCVMAVLLSGIMTWLIMMIIKATVGADIDHKVEETGLDLMQIGEQAYDDSLDIALDLGNESATTLLCEAAAAGNVQEVARICKSGASPHLGDYDGRRPLHLAASEGRFGVCKYLIDAHKVDVNVKDKFGNVPLMEAIHGGHKRVVALLCEHGAKGDEVELSDAIVEAAAQGDDERVKLLVGGGAPIDAGDYDQRSPLMVAAASGHLRVVETLLELGADPDKRDRWGNIALSDAERHGHGAIADVLRKATGKQEKKRLLDKMANKLLEETADAEPETAVQATVRELCAAAQDGNVKEMKRLMKRGADITATDYDGRSLLHLAAGNGHIDALHFILRQKNVNVNALDRWHNTPLNEALKANQPGAVELLRKHHAVVVNKEIGSRLCRAAALNKRDELETMAGRGVNLKCADYDGRTPLHLAASEGHVELVQWLLKQNVNVAPIDRFGYTSADDAARHKHKSIAKLLKKAATKQAADDASDSSDDEVDQNGKLADEKATNAILMKPVDNKADEGSESSEEEEEESSEEEDSETETEEATYTYEYVEVSESEEPTPEPEPKKSKKSDKKSDKKSKKK